MILIASRDKLNTEAINNHCDKVKREGILSLIFFNIFFIPEILEGIQ